VRKGLWLAASLLIIMALLVGGCVGRPRGIKRVRWLTEDEKNRVIKIALHTREAERAREGYGPQYTASLGWVAIVWGNSEYSEWWGLDYEWETDPNFSLIPESAEFYSWVVINFGEPPQWQVYVAVNPDTGKVALVEENPFRTGPPPPEEVK